MCFLLLPSPLKSISMNISLRQRAVRGFTLIELLIVVIIIAILAAIAIPQFSSSSKDAQEAALDANLATVRSSIELYRVQHGNVYPGLKVSSGGTVACAGTKGGGDVNTEKAFVDQLTAYSNAAGQTCTVRDAVEYTFGPYVRAVPAEPISNVATVTVSNAVLGAATADAKGWNYSTLTGQFLLNSSTPDSKTKAYSTH
jgi:prepilin-type N-terminal cleavage/methylation domain-containing protein